MGRAGVCALAAAAAASAALQARARAPAAVLPRTSGRPRHFRAPRALGWRRGAVVSSGPRARCRGTAALRASESSVDEEERQPSVFGSACLVAGASIGGGFLALPRATAAPGLVPSAVSLMGCWFYLSLCATALAEASLRVMRRAEEEEVCEIPDDLEEYLMSGRRDAASTLCKTSSGSGELEGNGCDVSMFAVMYTALGMGENARFRKRKTSMMGLMTVSVFLIFNAVLTAQVAKAGSLLAGPAGLNTGAACCVSALAMGLIAFSIPERGVVKVSSLLTGGMVLSFVAVLVGALLSAGSLHFPRLLRSEWAALLPPAAVPGREAWRINVFVQMLGFSEMVCLICGRHGPGRPRAVMKALWLGSAVPLAMSIAWAAAAINMTPRSITEKLADPLQAFLTASPFTAWSMGTFAACAIITTVVGSALAEQQFVLDALGGLTLRGKIVVSTAVIGLPTLFALCGGDLFYQALAFCGGYPVLLLYCVMPPWLCLRLRRQDRAAGRYYDARMTKLVPGGSLVLRTIMGVGAMLLLTNVSFAALSACRAYGWLPL